MKFTLKIRSFYIDSHPAAHGRAYWLIGWGNTNHAGGYTLREIIVSAWREALFYLR